jgi:hypothetical protein
MAASLDELRTAAKALNYAAARIEAVAAEVEAGEAEAGKGQSSEVYLLAEEVRDVLVRIRAEHMKLASTTAQAL